MSESTLCVSLREFRLVVGRLLYSSGLIRGVVDPVREVLVDGQALGLNPLSDIEHDLPTLHLHNGVVSFEFHGSDLHIDGLGAPCYLLVPGIVDIAVVKAHENERVNLWINNVTTPEIAKVMTIECAQMGVSFKMLECSKVGARAIVEYTGISSEYPEQHLRSFYRDGFAFDAQTWWRLYHLSNRALTPDSIVSREHGPIKEAGIGLDDAAWI